MANGRHLSGASIDEVLDDCPGAYTILLHESNSIVESRHPQHTATLTIMRVRVDEGVRLISGRFALTLL